MVQEYNIRRCSFDSASLLDIENLFKESFPKAKKFSVNYLKWQYLENPEGKALAFNAFAPDGTLAAHYAAIPITMSIGGLCRRGLLSLNTATHPAHQGKKLFTRLAETTYLFAKEQGFEFVVGVANGNSTHGFLKHLGFYLISPLEVKIGIGNIFKTADFSKKNRRVWTSESLGWRLSCPWYKYYNRNGNLYGRLLSPLIQTVVGLVKDDHVLDGIPLPTSIFNLYIGLGIERYSCLYIDLPKFIKRSPFNLIFKDLTEEGLPVLSIKDTAFQLLDFDVA